MGEQFGQRRPPLSVTIKQILERYPDGQIFKVCAIVGGLMKGESVQMLEWTTGTHTGSMDPIATTSAFMLKVL